MGWLLMTDLVERAEWLLLVDMVESYRMWGGC